PQFTLPHRLELTTADLPLATGYLHATAEDDAAWTARLPTGGKPKVGVV
ncbi:MAG: hypothetical protein FD153_1318, partial [Rhodospirillaceae bacterium]